jgi:hypothetical protein
VQAHRHERGGQHGVARAWDAAPDDGRAPPPAGGVGPLVAAGPVDARRGGGGGGGGEEGGGGQAELGGDAAPALALSKGLRVGQAPAVGPAERVKAARGEGMSVFCSCGWTNISLWDGRHDGFVLPEDCAVRCDVQIIGVGEVLYGFERCPT